MVLARSFVFLLLLSASTDYVILYTNPFSYQLCSEFFKLMNEVENEDLVFTLETIVDKFGEEMAPYALGLCQNLVRIFVIRAHLNAKNICATKI